jgi:hypothetical protein
MWAPDDRQLEPGQDSQLALPEQSRRQAEGPAWRWKTPGPSSLLGTGILSGAPRGQYYCAQGPKKLQVLVGLQEHRCFWGSQDFL